MIRKNWLKPSLAALALTFATNFAAAEGAKIFVVGGKPDDPFWSKVKNGAEDAGKVVEAQGGSVTWLGPQNYDNLGADAAELIRQAIDQKRRRHRRPGLGARGHGPCLQGGRRCRHSAHHLQCRRHRGGRASRRHELCRQRRLQGGLCAAANISAAMARRTSSASTRCPARPTSKPAARASTTASRKAGWRCGTVLPLAGNRLRQRHRRRAGRQGRPAAEPGRRRCLTIGDVDANCADQRASCRPARPARFRSAA